MGRGGMDSANCVRFACGCVVFLCIVWPALLITGIVLMTTHNPQQSQMEQMNEASESFKSTSAILEATGGRVEEGPGIKSTFSHTAVPGSSVKSVYLESLGTTRIPENVGDNTGTLTVVLQYKSQEFHITSPPVTLSRQTSKEIECEISYSSVCGSRTCCKDEQMNDRCNKVYPNSNAVFVTNNQVCGLGKVCGQCEYDEHVSSVCMVVAFSASNGWVRDPSMSSCFYPFEPADQTYDTGNSGTMVFVRAADDPFIVLQRLSKGKMVLDETNDQERSSGRGILLCGIVAFLVLISLICLIHLCHVSVCDTKALRRAMNLKVSEDNAALGKDRKDQQLLSVPDDGTFVDDLGDVPVADLDDSHNPYGSRLGASRKQHSQSDGDFSQYSPRASGAYSPPASFRDVGGPNVYPASHNNYY